MPNFDFSNFQSHQDYITELGKRTATNESIQPGGRPGMQQEDHPAHNVPKATEHHDGTVLKTGDSAVSGSDE